MRRALLAFYDGERRDLAWRRTSDPYRIWISEVMLQQTRVAAVIPFYERWLARFPTVEALAGAPTDDVLRTWEGLGYYSRARNLQQAARIVTERHAGCVPRDPATLRSLPGIGEYTAGAIASIAYGVRAPAVDGNVRRVLARLLDEPRPSPALLRRVASALVPAERAGDFNQALIELGATVCIRTGPVCERCPIARVCLAHARGTQAERPAPRARKAVPTIDLATAVVLDGRGRVLVVRRPDRGLLAGLWCFPAAPVEGVAAAAAEEVVARLGVRVRNPQPLGTITHLFTHRRERYHVVRFRTSAPPPRAAAPSEARFVSARGLSDLPMPTAQRRIAEIALGGKG